jgi:hypothetical protein
MHVEIFSMMAAISGRYPSMWRGDLDQLLIPDDLTHPPSIPDRVYRHFNRVDEADAVRLKAIGYDLPSLSVGDYFTIKFSFWPQAKTYRVAGNGFEEITGNPNAIMEAFK